MRAKLLSGDAADAAGSRRTCGALRPHVRPTRAHVRHLAGERTCGRIGAHVRSKPSARAVENERTCDRLDRTCDRNRAHVRSKPSARAIDWSARATETERTCGRKRPHVRPRTSARAPVFGAICGAGHLGCPGHLVCRTFLQYALLPSDAAAGDAGHHEHRYRRHAARGDLARSRPDLPRYHTSDQTAGMLGAFLRSPHARHVADHPSPASLSRLPRAVRRSPAGAGLAAARLPGRFGHRVWQPGLPRARRR